MSDAKMLAQSATENLLKLKSEEQRSQMKWMSEKESLMQKLESIKSTNKYSTYKVFHVLSQSKLF